MVNGMALILTSFGIDLMDFLPLFWQGSISLTRKTKWEERVLKRFGEERRYMISSTVTNCFLYE